MRVSKNYSNAIRGSRIKIKFLFNNTKLSKVVFDIKSHYNDINRTF